MDGVRYIVLHHSATDYDSSAAQIADYHISLGWQTIGYTWVCRWDGTIEWALDLEARGNHVAGRNPECIGICCPGDYTQRQPRPLQLASALKMARRLKERRLPWAVIVGHKEIALKGYETACPGHLLD